MATKTVCAAEVQLGELPHHDQTQGRQHDASVLTNRGMEDGKSQDDDTPSGSTPAAEVEPVPPSMVRSVVLMATLSCVSFLNTFNSGVLTVALPTIAKNLDLPNNLMLWPASVYALALCCTLLLLGSIADIVGNRPLFLVGNMLYTVWTLAVSLSRTGNELIVFRTLQGIAMSFCMPTAVSTITTTFPSGKYRNIAFATFGGGSPLGFAIGLVLGGIFVKYCGWRSAYYMSTGINAVTFLLAWYVIPSPVHNRSGSRTYKRIWNQLRTELDWFGVMSISLCLSLFSFIFAELTYSGSVMKKTEHIVLLIVAVLLIPVFIFWERRQEQRGLPAVLPNSVWGRGDFTIICLTVFLVWSWFNAYGYWSTLFFQETQHLDALQAALRFLPMVIVGIGTNIVAGLILDKVSAGKLVLFGGLVSAVSPLLFALQSPSWTYWAAGFPAMILSVVSTDLLFNISNLIITTNFSPKKQALAGGVFNTITQLGNSLGLAVTAIIAAAVTDSESDTVPTDTAILKGYRAAFWTCFAAAAASAVISSFGLRNTGKVGAKKDI